MKHLALVEDYYFSVRLMDNPHAAAFGQADSDNDAGDEWRSAASDEPTYLYELWQRMVDQSRRLTSEALSNGGLDQPVQQSWPDVRSPSLRRTLLDLIEEYARHVGHADLIRESVDGLVGEDPPGIHE